MQSAAGTLIAVTIAGIVSPSGVVKSVSSTVWDAVIPGPSATEREVDALLEQVQGNDGFWTDPPSINSTVRAAAIEAWDRLRPDREYFYSLQPFPVVSVGELYTNSVWDGEIVRVQGNVSQVYPFDEVAGQPDLTKVDFRVSGANETMAWCIGNVAAADDVPAVDQLVEVAGLVIARGSAATADGGFRSGTLLICPRVEPLVSASHAAEVAELLRSEEGSSFWSEAPSLSSDARTYMIENWRELSPYTVHPFPDRPPPYVEIDQIREDDRFDGRMSWVSGFVTQRTLSSSGPKRTYLRVRLQVAGQDGAIWCRTTVQNERMFEEGEHLEAVGVPYARGSARVTNGDFLGITMMVCPAMRRV